MTSKLNETVPFEGLINLKINAKSCDLLSVKYYTIIFLVTPASEAARSAAERAALKSPPTEKIFQPKI